MLKKHKIMSLLRESQRDETGSSQSALVYLILHLTCLPLLLLAGSSQTFSICLAGHIPSTHKKCFSLICSDALAALFFLTSPPRTPSRSFHDPQRGSTIHSHRYMVYFTDKKILTFKQAVHKLTNREPCGT